MQSEGQNKRAVALWTCGKKAMKMECIPIFPFHQNASDSVRFHISLPGSPGSLILSELPMDLRDCCSAGKNMSLPHLQFPGALHLLGERGGPLEEPRERVGKVEGGLE